MFDLPTYLRKQAACIEAALEAALPPAAEPPVPLHEAMRYSVFSGGKRLRPILCLAAAEACGATAPAMPAAVAVELLHTYTLIHDDLPCMDDDDIRRGKPTVHRAFGEAVAVLAGDALQALAFEQAAAGPVPAALVGELARAAGSRGVVGGQAADLAAAGRAPAPAEIDYIHRNKTAALFRAALRLGALAADGDPKALHALSDYGENIGLAFQITDDLLDGTPGYAHADGRHRARALTDAAVAALQHPALRQTEPLRALAEFLLGRTT
jgi:geranylgeranyl diphosphate synthase, type II